MALDVVVQGHAVVSGLARWPGSYDAELLVYDLRNEGGSELHLWIFVNFGDDFPGDPGSVLFVRDAF
jgi:hypothetical protein